MASPNIFFIWSLCIILGEAGAVFADLILVDVFGSSSVCNPPWLRTSIVPVFPSWSGNRTTTFLLAHAFIRATIENMRTRRERNETTGIPPEIYCRIRRVLHRIDFRLIRNPDSKSCAAKTYVSYRCRKFDCFRRKLADDSGNILNGTFEHPCK